MDYILIRKKDSAKLGQAVNIAISTGYIPQGGVSCIVIPQDRETTSTEHAFREPEIWFTQAMIHPDL